MISVIAQERLLGAALGSILTGTIVFEERKRIYRSVSDDQPHCATASLMKEPIFGKMTRAEIAHLWNRTVDKTLGPVIESLSSRGCSVKKEESLKAEHLKYLAEIERGKIPTARNTARARPTAMPAILPCWTALDRDSESLLDRASTAPTWAAIGSGEQLKRVKRLLDSGMQVHGELGLPLQLHSEWRQTAERGLNKECWRMEYCLECNSGKRNGTGAGGNRMMGEIRMSDGKQWLIRDSFSSEGLTICSS
ncbi:hypothetical protein SAY87_001888 [Trapa incisa]|uniref:Uncharacterized protein n=1 Tax=Trapa incisa TaxID=236973 RepID=A0AAN7PTZ2_9MYRT|nr:hypothetical protein SAY87_001888 [Trapa incisa]